MKEKIEQLSIILRTATPKRTLALAGFLLVILAIPLTVAVSQRQQNLEQEAATPPPAPTGLSAAPFCPTGVNEKISSITFSWSAVSLANSYQLYFWTSPYADSNRNGPYVTNGTSMVLPKSGNCASVPGSTLNCGFTPGQTIKWIVRGVAFDGTIGNSPVAQFTTPTASCPISGGTLQQPLNLNGDSYYGFPKGSPRTNTEGTVFTTFTWSPVTNAVEYDLTYKNEAGTTFGPYRLKGSSSTSFTGPQPVGSSFGRNFLECNPSKPTGFACGFKCGQSNLDMTVIAYGPSGQVSQSTSKYNTASCQQQGTPPSCTLSANPNKVNVNESSQLSATCTGNPDQFSWSESCGLANKVNSPNTSWKAPGNQGNCSVSVNACNSFDCSKPSTTIQVVSPSPAPSPSPSATPSPSPTPAPDATTLLLSIGLDGLGSTGDDRNPNPIANSNPIYRSNPNPIHKIRDIKIIIKNSSGAQVDLVDTKINFATDGKFKSTVVLKSGFPTGTYSITVKVPNYIEEPIANNLTITAGAKNVPVSGNLSTGDIDNNNELTILDYNILISCYIYSPNTGACNANNRTISDLTDNGVNDHDDYNLHLRDWSEQ